MGGEDQYLWALDRDTGTTVWKTFFESPLLSSPVLIGERLFMQVPSEGLVCFEAFRRTPWTACALDLRPRRARSSDSAATGSPGVGRPNKILTTVDAKRGGVVEIVSLPRVARIVTTAPVDGDLYASSKDGRLTRLVKP